VTWFWWLRWMLRHPLIAWFWRLRWTLRHPLIAWAEASKWRHRPDVGDLVVDCRGKTLRVTAVSTADPDTLTLEDGTHASWMHCCDYPEET
jgi:hypothetical protein